MSTSSPERFYLDYGFDPDSGRYLAVIYDQNPRECEATALASGSFWELGECEDWFDRQVREQPWRARN